MKIAGYILAGGDNRRMEGKKKLYLKREGKPFGQWICEAFAELPEIYLSVADVPPGNPGLAAADALPGNLGLEEEADVPSGNRMPEAEAVLPPGVLDICGRKLPLVYDRYGHIGPIGGIASGLGRCQTEALFVAACDMPFISREAVGRMLEAYKQNPVLTVARSGDRVHPLFGIYPKELLAVLEEQIRNRDYRMMHILDRVEYGAVDFGGDSGELKNINTTAQYRQMDRPYIFAVSGYKNSGKTTLITQVIPVLVSRGFRVAVIKHDGHDFESDVPGTDSYRHQKAGAYGTAVYSGSRVLVTKEIQGVDETRLFAAFPEADIILIEGLKDGSYPRYFCNYPEQEPVSPEELAERILEGRRESMGC